MFIKPFLMEFLMTKIAIEATGCDKGFNEVLEGAKKASEKDSDLELILVAGKDKLPKEYHGIKKITDKIILEQTDYTYNSEDPKNNQLRSSIYRAMELHKNSEVEAVIAPGDTRGSVVAAERILGLMKNVLAPAIPTLWPRNNVLIDSGANPESTPENVLQSAIMGHVYSKYFIKVESPLIGLVTNGRERSKGNRFVKKCRRLIEDRLKKYNLSELYFEGDCVSELDCGQVRLVDGHTGNIKLKTAEGCLTTSFTILFDKIKDQSPPKKLAAKYALKGPIMEMKKELNYESYAAGPLLGILGNVMICHAKSEAEAIVTSIEVTKNYLKRGINQRLEEEIMKYGVIKYGVIKYSCKAD